MPHLLSVDTARAGSPSSHGGSCDHPIFSLNVICSEKSFSSPSLKFSQLFTLFTRHSFPPYLNALWNTYHQLMLPAHHIMSLIKHLLLNPIHWHKSMNHIRPTVMSCFVMDMSSTSPQYRHSETQWFQNPGVKIHVKYDYRCVIRGNWKRLTVTSLMSNQTSCFRDVPGIFHEFIPLVIISKYSLSIYTIPNPEEIMIRSQINPPGLFYHLLYPPNPIPFPFC